LLYCASLQVQIHVGV
ncbi:unnamed protein product, partial [Allacma fusca]